MVHTKDVVTTGEENFNNYEVVKLTPLEQSLYKKAITFNPNLTEKEFLKLRNEVKPKNGCGNYLIASGIVISIRERQETILCLNENRKEDDDEK